jgi:branched-chain amino acid transport system permease protein
VGLAGPPLIPAKVSNFLTLPRTQRYIIIGLIVAALIWPFFGSRGAVDIATLILIYVLLGLGLNIVVGLAGLLDLGYVGFYAVGAYSYALLSHYLGWSFWICLPMAGMAAATFGFLLGFPVLRLRGDYLAIVTLGFGEIIRLFLRNLTDITGGPNGISNIPKPTFFGLTFERPPPKACRPSTSSSGSNTTR